MTHIQNINKIIIENSNQDIKLIIKLINKYCRENPSIIDIPTKVLNKNITLKDYSFNKNKNIVRIKRKSYNPSRKNAAGCNAASPTGREHSS